MATQDVQKFPGPSPTTETPITPPAIVANDTRSAQDRFVDQQWRDAARLQLGKTHPKSINLDTNFA